MNWPRVSHRNPCPICGKPDWCTIAPEGNGNCCMRIQSGKSMRNGGWWHPNGSKTKGVHWHRIPPPPPPPPPDIDCDRLLKLWSNDTPRIAQTNLAENLGVDADAIRRLEPVWAREHKAWAFPMRNATGQVVGIRLRAADGRKWAVRGSRQGIFIPQGMPPQDVMCVCEGPTDTAAALTLGLYAVGRPSCMCGGPEIMDHAKAKGVRRIVIVSDNDGPGLDGAEKLAKELKMPSIVLVLPAKDMRDFVRWGGTRSMINDLMANHVWSTQY